MLISIVIIEYFCIDDIESLIGVVGNEFNADEVEIIISSNSVHPQLIQKSLVEKYPHVKWLFNSVNEGFSGGMNKGIQSSNGNYVLIANPDIHIDSGSLREACFILGNSPGIGMIVPKFIDQHGVTQDYARRFITIRELAKRLLYRLAFHRDVIPYEDFDYDSTQDVDWSAGAFMLVRRDALNVVGCFDSGYFMYVEDMDWCRRFWCAGFRVRYYAELIVRYKGDMKSSSFLVRKTLMNKYTYYHLKSQVRYFIKFGFKRYSPSALKADAMHGNLAYVERVKRYFDRVHSSKANIVGVSLYDVKKDERISVLQPWLKYSQGKSILDIGCGDGSLIGRSISDLPDYIKLKDVAQLKVTRAMKLLEKRAIQVDGEVSDIFTDNDQKKYDIVLMIGVTDYYKDWQRLVQKAMDSSESILIIDVPKPFTFRMIIRKVWLLLHGVRVYGVTRPALERALMKIAPTYSHTIKETTYNWMVRLQLD